MPQIYQVGGCVRDRLLGIKSKDIDFTYVCDQLDQTVEQGFREMTDYLNQEGYTIFLSTPDMYTIRAKFPSDHQFEGMVADFVMARKEVGYIQGTRRPKLELGSLYDDLFRRDFTLNAMAEGLDGGLIDYFDGQKHLNEKILRTPRPCRITFDEDPLRILRAIRFAITKGFSIPGDMWIEIKQYDYNDKMGVVSGERIREELSKCFKHDTYTTLYYLNSFPYLNRYIFQNVQGIWLKPTFEQ